MAQQQHGVIGMEISPKLMKTTKNKPQETGPGIKYDIQELRKGPENNKMGETDANRHK